MGIDFGYGIGSVKLGVCTSTTRPASPYDGQVIYMTDVDQTAVWDGSAWVVLAPIAGGRNKVINGGMSVWQRGTSFSNPAAYAYTADRWIIEHDGTGATRTISQQTFTPGAAPVSGYEGQYFLRYAVSVAGTGNTYQFVGQRIEDARTLAGQTVTISFWAKADTTRTITVGCDQNFGSGGSSAAVGFSGTADVTTSWQRFTITGSLPSLSGKTIGTSSFVTLYFKAPALSTCTIDYWGVQLEAGAVATPFEFEDYGTTLKKCERYFKVLNPPLSRGTFTSTTSVGRAASSIGGTMRVAPTVSWSGTMFLYDGASVGTATSPSGWYTTTNDIEWEGNTATGTFTQYRVCMVYANAGSGTASLSAEL